MLPPFFILSFSPKICFINSYFMCQYSVFLINIHYADYLHRNIF
ncbi:hypothetical protein NC651_020241 [Populus alba x Populus x berolinensis]|nr:hypothetical protein NC651_020241 [Populus alba x Populus x berolinensis]